MATPRPHEWNAALYDFAGMTIRDYIHTYVPVHSPILDIGAGWGKYKLLLPEYQMDACEIWFNNVEANKLHKLYRNVIVADICEYVNREIYYNAAILGDVLEHIPADRAQQLIQTITRKIPLVMVAIPYRMPQTEVEGNPYEKHEQDDLTAEVMSERYPQLRLVAVEGHKGVYASK